MLLVLKVLELHILYISTNFNRICYQVTTISN